MPKYEPKYNRKNEECYITGVYKEGENDCYTCLNLHKCRRARDWVKYNERKRRKINEQYE